MVESECRVGHCGTSSSRACNRHRRKPPGLSGAYVFTISRYSGQQRTRLKSRVPCAEGPAGQRTFPYSSLRSWRCFPPIGSASEFGGVRDVARSIRLQTIRRIKYSASEVRTRIALPRGKRICGLLADAVLAILSSKSNATLYPLAGIVCRVSGFGGVRGAARSIRLQAIRRTKCRIPGNRVPNAGSRDVESELGRAICDRFSVSRMYKQSCAIIVRTS
jgi:hypothetical protein